MTFLEWNEREGRAREKGLGEKEGSERDKGRQRSVNVLEWSEKEVPEKERARETRGGRSVNLLLSGAREKGL